MRLAALLLAIACARGQAASPQSRLPFAPCRLKGSGLPAQCAPLAERLRGDALAEDRFRKCLAAYDADPRQYTTSAAMQDLDDVRAALGYAQIDLWGASYGTRAALIYLREHGEHVRTAVLDGV